ncbi:MAG: helix-turn-helix transcriptional regulator [Proteobacteria bacterium]|nr:helix-turn-helix transcriptional regulator [Pseudomonadota bacterium]
MIGGENPIKVFREYRGLTQKQLAKKTDTSAAYLSQIETGRRTGSIKLLRRLAGALNVEVEDLI